MTPTDRTILLVLIAALLALLVAVITAWLVASSGTRIQHALLSAGAAFGSTMTLVVLVLSQTRAL
jgi:hypothetical protein